MILCTDASLSRLGASPDTEAHLLLKRLQNSLGRPRACLRSLEIAQPLPILRARRCLEDEDLLEQAAIQMVQT
jgi:hypothetical protein